MNPLGPLAMMLHEDAFGVRRLYDPERGCVRNRCRIDCDKPEEPDMYKTPEPVVTELQNKLADYEKELNRLAASNTEQIARRKAAEQSCAKMRHARDRVGGELLAMVNKYGKEKQVSEGLRMALEQRQVDLDAALVQIKELQQKIRLVMDDYGKVADERDKAEKAVREMQSKLDARQELLNTVVMERDKLEKEMAQMRERVREQSEELMRRPPEPIPVQPLGGLGQTHTSKPKWSGSGPEPKAALRAAADILGAEINAANIMLDRLGLHRRDERIAFRIMRLLADYVTEGRPLPTKEQLAWAAREVSS